MSKPSRRTSRRLGALAVLGAVAAAVVLVPSALSTSTSKTFSASVDNTSVSAGTNGQSFNLTITNLGSPALDSAKIQAPAGFIIKTASPGTIVNNVIQLPTLNLASTDPPLQVAITADVPCTSSSATWGISAWQNANFSGNRFTQVGTTSTDLGTSKCTLAITSQPNNAVVNTVITDIAYDPTGNKVTVEARNGANVKANAATDTVKVDKAAGFFTSGGNTGFINNSLALSGGSVSFPDLQSTQTGTELKLQATNPGYNSSSLSNAFDISVDGKNCVTGTPCSANTGNSGAHTKVTVNGANTDNSNLGVGLLGQSTGLSQSIISSGVCGANFTPLGNSDGFTETVQETGTTLSHPDYTITLVYDKSVNLPVGGVSSIQVCMGARRIESDLNSPNFGLPRSCTQDIADGKLGFPTANDPNGDLSFKAKCDTATGAWLGLLPKAAPGINACTDPRLTDPAVLSENRGGGNAAAIVTICKPGGTEDGDWDSFGHSG